MKSTLLRLLPLLGLLTVSIHAADSNLIAAVQAADDARVSATRSGNRAQLDAIYSNDLHYAHSSGKIDTKASYVESLVKRSTVYEKYDYAKREFRPAGPGIVLMTGRALIESSSADGKQQNDLNFLAVWRLEGGTWRFLAWQSCKNPPATLPPTQVKINAIAR